MYLIKRENCLKQIRPFIETDIIKVLTGMRRCGKSAMLELIKAELAFYNCKKTIAFKSKL